MVDMTNMYLVAALIGLLYVIIKRATFNIVYGSTAQHNTMSVSGAYLLRDALIVAGSVCAVMFAGMYITNLERALSPASANAPAHPTEQMSINMDDPTF